MDSLFLSTATQLLIALALVGISLVIAELMRDLWHALCHRISWLYNNFHRWHHVAYSADFKIRSKDLFRKSQWRHGLPEAVVMITGTGLLLGILVLSKPGWYVIAASYGFLYSLRELSFVILRGFGFQVHEDLLHVTEALKSSPGQMKVNLAYHWNHHFMQPCAYFGGLFTPVDQILGTALSLKRKRVCVLHQKHPIWIALVRRLIAAGASVQALEPETDFSKVDILIVAKGNESLIDQFLATVRSNKDIANKELWWVHTSSEDRLPHGLEKRARCTTRDVAILNVHPDKYDWLAQLIVFQAKRDIRYILATNELLTALLHRLNLSVSNLWIRQTSRSQLAPQDS